MGWGGGGEGDGGMCVPACVHTCWRACVQKFVCMCVCVCVCVRENYLTVWVFLSTASLFIVFLHSRSHKENYVRQKVPAVPQ